MSIFYIPPSSSSSSSSSDVTILEGQVNLLKAEVNSATAVNSNSTLVKRDATGGFAASTVKLNAIESNGATLDIAAQNGTSTVNLGKGTGVQTINVGNNGTGATTINLGGGSDTVRVNLPLKNASGADVLAVGSTACFVGSIGNPSGAGNTFVGTGISTTAGQFGTYNTGMGNLTLAALSTGGEYNVAMGVQALGGVTTGKYNVAVGSRAGWDPLPEKCQISGTGCTFIGTDSKPNNVTPLVNATAIGSQAVVDASNTIQLGHVGLVAVKTAGTHYAAGLESIGTTLTIAGQNNTSVVDIGKGTGVQAINLGNNGTGATTINLGGGSDAVQVNLPLKDSAGATILNAISGSNGDASLFVGNIGNHTGKGNTYCGTQISTTASKFGEYNTAMGSLALSFVDIGGNENVAMGHRALAAVSTGTGNVGIGTRAGHDVSNAANRITTGSNCTFIGTDAKGNATGMVNATAIGAGALVDASNTIQLGNAVTAVKTSGTLHAAGLESIGTTLTIAGQNNTSVVDIGKGTGVQTINMGNNGVGATTIKLGGGSDAVHVNLPLRNSGGTSILNAINGNCTFGPNSMPSVTGANGNNTAVGSNSGAANVTGFGNTFLGYDSGKNANGVGLLTNTAVGHSSLLNMIECDDNTAVGHASLVALSTGNRNTALGKASGGGVTTGTNNTFLGFNTSTTSGSVTNSTAIGNGASVDASNMIQLGNASVTAVKTAGTITAGGLILPTTGGTAATLSHYEEYDWVFQWKYGANLSTSVTVKIVKIGKVVTYSMANLATWNASGSSQYFEPSVLPPERFRPVVIGSTYSRMPLCVETGGVGALGMMTHSAGTYSLRVYAGPNSDLFASSGANSIFPFHVSWVTA